MYDEEYEEKWEEEEPVYWGRAGAGVLPVAKSTGRFLVPFRSGQVLEPYTWGVIGGKIDEDEYGELEEPEETVAREFFEETLYKANLELIPLYIFEDESQDFGYYNYLGVVEEEFDPAITWETDRWSWLTLEELLDLEPKHFGLEALLDDDESFELIEAYSTPVTSNPFGSIGSVYTYRW